MKFFLLSILLTGIGHVFAAEQAEVVLPGSETIAICGEVELFKKKKLVVSSKENIPQNWNYYFQVGNKTHQVSYKRLNSKTEKFFSVNPKIEITRHSSEIKNVPVIYKRANKECVDEKPESVVDSLSRESKEIPALPAEKIDGADSATQQ